MKKIGIVTFHRPNNYGANLQAYALQEVINNMGYETKIIDYRNKEIDKPYRILTIDKGIIELIKSIIFLIKNIIGKKNFIKFRKNNYILTEPIYNKKQLEEQKLFNIYISGSDQIWNTKLTNQVDDIYTLNFNVNGAQKISYASSMGNADMNEKEMKEIAKRIKEYDNISVREQSAKKRLEKYIKKDIEVVLDPTILLSKEEWEEVIDKSCKENANQEYILFYTLAENDETFKIINRLSEVTGLKVITLRRTNKRTNNVIKNLYTEGPAGYIQLFKNAKYIVTSSFHGTVFSIIFNKKFFVTYGGKENSRVDNLLNICKLKDRHVESSEQLTNELINKEINYNSINEIIEIERKKSKEFIKNAIEKKV